MKTAISLPDPLFERASRRASKLGLRCSEFFARAAHNYLDTLDARSVTKQIDVALAGIDGDDEASSAAVEAGHRALSEGSEEW
jgi:hypothetical protein